MDDQDVIREFLVESHENLSRLDRDLVELEKHPKDDKLLASVFRTMHTIKGTCGFLAFSTLERISHQAETLLSQLRDGERELSPQLVSLILETVDATRKVLASIEAGGEEGPEQFEELTERLRAMAESKDGAGSPPVVAAPPVPAAEHAEAPAPVEHPEGAKPEEEAAKSSAVAKPEEEASKSSAAADSNIRVGVVLLDKLMDLVGELVLTRNQILQFNTEREDATLNVTAQRLNLITTELQEGVMKTRMQPIGVVWNNLPRVVRDMAVALGKQVRLEMVGAETELDRTIIEAIKDPLVHLVRNSCDHGIEPPEARVRAGKPPQGTLTLRAYHEGGHVTIEIIDDGAGVNVDRVKAKAVQKGLAGPEQVARMSDREALNLLFLPGFSTAETVTNVSGRGVGMDVVKSNIERIGGVVDLTSRWGEGTTLKLKIPLTLAIIPGLVVTVGNSHSTAREGAGHGERFVIPQVSLLELIRLEGEAGQKQIERIHGTRVYRRRGILLPIAYLNEVLGIESDTTTGVVNIVVLQAEDHQFGLVVDGINDTQDIVVKPLGKQLKGLNCYAGATIMGDGHVVLILDVLGIGQRSGVLVESREQARGAKEQKAQSGLEQQRLLLFRAGSFERLAVPLSLVARLEEFPQSSIEHAGGCQVVQYRNRILPLIPLRAVLEAGAAEGGEAADPAQVIVFNDGDRSVGLMVDQILDVAEEVVTVRQQGSRAGLLGSAVVGKRVADFLDLNYVIRSAAGGWFQGGSGSAPGSRILLAEGSAFSRGLLRSGLDMAGYRVLEAGNLDQAIRGLEQQPVDIVVAAMDLPPKGSSALLEAMRRRPEWEGIPMLALADTAEQIRARAGQSVDFQDCQVKFDREAMLESVARLAAALASAELAPAGAGKEK
ncbi:MAG: chemotaxis protein CheW [Bryobacteraceae bacterium]